jgi:tRNA modification GTPase
MPENRRLSMPVARRDIAIVSDTPGTTRDVIEARLDLGGYLLLVADTAGVARPPNPSKQKGCGGHCLMQKAA